MISKLIEYLSRAFAWLRALVKRDPDRFLMHLMRHAFLVVKGADALIAYMEKPTKAHAKILRQLEKEADEIRRILMDELNRTFVTPLDREDISMLSRNIDDVIDYAWRMVNEMDILAITPNQYLIDMAVLIREGADELRLAMERLSDHPHVANDHAVRAGATNNSMEHLYATALADLFQEDKKTIDAKTVIQMMKLRESYRHMLYAAESVGRAADTIIDIVVKFF